MSDDRTGLWGIHSEKDDRPMMRGWAESEADALEFLERVKASDPVPEDEYWIDEMTDEEAECHRAAGLLPD